MTDAELADIKKAWLGMPYMALSDERGQMCGVIHALADEVDRLRGLLSGPPKVTKFTYTPEDGVEVEIEHWAVKQLAASLWDTFDEDGGINFVVMDVHGHERGTMEVTLRKVRGCEKTPAGLIAELRAEVERLKAKCGEV